MTITYFNNKRHTVDILITANTGDIIISGNDSVSNVALAGQVLTGASIRCMHAQSPSGNSAYWEVKRAATVVSTPDSTSFVDYAGNGMEMNVGAAANLVCDIVGVAGDAGCVLYIQLRKEFDIPDDSSY